MDPTHTGGLYDFLLTALEVRDGGGGRRQKYSGQWGRRLPCPGHCCAGEPRVTARMCFRGKVCTESLVLPLLKELGKGPLLHPSPWVPGAPSMFQATSLSITGEGRPLFLQTGAEAELETGWSRRGDGVPGYWADYARGRGQSGHLPLSLASFLPVLLRAHPEGRYEAAPLSWPLGLQGALVARPPRAHCRAERGRHGLPRGDAAAAAVLNADSCDPEAGGFPSPSPGH